MPHVIGIVLQLAYGHWASVCWGITARAGAEKMTLYGLLLTQTRECGIGTVNPKIEHAMISYESVVARIRDAGYYVAPVEQLDNWDRIVLSSKQRAGGGYSGNSFWLTVLSNTWILGTWGGILYQFRDSNSVIPCCIRLLSQQPNEVLVDIRGEHLERFELVEVSEGDFDALRHRIN